MAKYNRKVPLRFTPVVTHDGKGAVYIKTGSFHGTTRYEATAELSIWCTSKLIKDLRVALRAIRDDHKRRLDEVIGAAEQQL